MSCNPKSGTELKKEEFASTMMVKTSIDSGAAPVSYLNEEYLVARDRSDGMSSIVYRRSGGGGKYEKASVLKGHEMIVKSLANDGADTVVSGGWDGRVLAWKVIGQGCQIQKRVQRGNKGLYVLLSRTQAGTGRTVKQEQEGISTNHVQRINLISVYTLFDLI